MEPIIGDTRSTAGNIEMFTESGWTKVAGMLDTHKIDMDSKLLGISKKQS